MGLAGVYGATRRYAAFNQLTLPLKAFLVTSSATFAGIIAADHSSRVYEKSRNLDQRFLKSREKELTEAETRGKTFTQRAYEFGKREKYKIIGGSWVGSIVLAFALVGRNPYLSGQQKLVQARVYAQGLTLAVMCAVAAVEIRDGSKGEGRWETVKYIDPNDPEHKHLIEKKVHKERYEGEDLWRDMVEAEEGKIKERDAAIKRQEENDRKKKKGSNHQEHKKDDGKPQQHEEKKNGGGGEKKKETKKDEKPKEENHMTDDGTEMELPTGKLPGKKGEGKMMRNDKDKPDGAEGLVP